MIIYLLREMSDHPMPITKKNIHKTIPWVEKYRPKLLTDIVSQNHIIHIIETQIQNNNLPNLLFYGPPGTGKTSTILSITNKLFPKYIYHDRVLMLNASDERGIKIVRGKIKQFSQKMISGDIPCKIKLIILDEADAMTDESQYALRRIMEQYSRTTRFCIICNYITRIIEPLQSRCSSFRFKVLNDNIIKIKCHDILKMENIQCSEDSINTIIRMCNGDLRKGITYLQKLSKSTTLSTIKLQNDLIKDSFIDNIITSITETPLEDIYTVVTCIHAHSYMLTDIIDGIYEYMISPRSIGILDDIKAQIIILLTKSSTLVHSDEFLQLLKLCAFLKSVL